MQKIVNGQVVQMTAEEISAREAEETSWEAGAEDRAWEELRQKRDDLLAETDWMAGSDVTMSAAWTTYRQNLRDLPENTTDVYNPVYPTKPTE